MMLVRCYLGPSEIEGLGVFSHDDIVQGQRVWVFEPSLDQRIPLAKLDEVGPHVREFLDRYTYTDMKMPGFVVLDFDEGRFMNHADEPNLDFSGWDYGIARWDIPAGTELTCNYADFTPGKIEMQPSRHMIRKPRKPVTVAAQ